jgi:hypothetical protein
METSACSRIGGTADARLEEQTVGRIDDPPEKWSDLPQIRSGEECGIDLAAPSIGLARSDLVDPTIEDIEKSVTAAPMRGASRDESSPVRAWPRKREQCMVGAMETRTRQWRTKYD